MSATLPERIDSNTTTAATDQMTPADVSHPAASNPRTSGSGKKKAVFGLFAVTGVAVLTGAVFTLAEDLGKPDQPLVFYTVKRGDLPITVTESGNLESQKTTDIRCEVENVGFDRSGGSGTQIIFIVPNGKMVTEGELLVELDAAPVRDRLDSQVLATERATSEEIQATVKYENQQTQNKTLLAEAELKVKLADLDLKQVEDEQGGTFQIEVQDIDLLIQEAQAKRLIQATDLKGIEALKKLGYRSKGDLEQARVNALAADRSLAQQLSRRKELVEYTQVKKRLTLEGGVATATRALEQVKRDNRALLAQAKAANDAAVRSLKKEKEKLTKYTAQLEKCKIYAPHGGMATYAVNSSRYSRSSSVIAEGAQVRERQKIITLPDLTQMQVKTAVHESVLDHIHDGLKTTITVDAFPDKKFKGSVKSVAVLPDAGGWLSSDIKVYQTIVTIDDEVSQLKPGMTAVVDIHVDRLKDVLSVPVQAIVQIERENWCYVEASGGIERRVLKLGRTNDKFVEVRDGLNEGDRVVLNPMAVIDEAEDRQTVISPDDGSDDNVDEDQTDSKSREEKQGGSTKTKKDSKQSQSKAKVKAEAKAKKKSKRTDSKAKSKGKTAGRGQRRGSFDLMQYDKDGDGKISVKDELPEQMRRFMGRTDSNSDGLIDSKEIEAMRAAMRNRARSRKKTSDGQKRDGQDGQ